MVEEKAMGELVVTLVTSGHLRMNKDPFCMWLELEGVCVFGCIF